MPWSDLRWIARAALGVTSRIPKAGFDVFEEYQLMPATPYTWECLLPDCHHFGQPMRTREAAVFKWLAHAADWHPDLFLGKPDQSAKFISDQP